MTMQSCTDKLSNPTTHPKDKQFPRSTSTYCAACVGEATFAPPRPPNAAETSSTMYNVDSGHHSAMYFPDGLCECGCILREQSQ